MNYITTYQDQLKKSISQSEISKIVGDLIILNTGVLITDVRERWQHGQSVSGGIIGRYSWDDYRLYKQSLNPLAGGNVDLMLTGALSDALTVRKVGNEYQIFSTDSKYEKLGRQYGFEEFGITEQQAAEFFDQLYDVAMETILGKLWE